MRSIEFFICSVVALSAPTIVLSQSTRYFDKQGTETDSANAFYSVTYIDKTSKSYYLNPRSIRYEEKEAENGEVIRTHYYQSGQIRAVGRLLKGQLDGPTHSFYENGNPEGEMVFEDNELSRASIVRVINYWDPNGNKIVDKGIGYCKCVLEPFDDTATVEEGKIMNQLKEGEWSASTPTYSYLETYENGELLKGRQNYQGETYYYTETREKAQPTGGLEAFYRHVGKVIKYPANARRKGIEGKVFVQFIVQKDGTLTDFGVVKGIGGGCDEEALRSVMSSPKWQPGKRRGRPVNQRYTLPIQFKLG
jgi:TonB family protein